MDINCGIVTIGQAVSLAVSGVINLKTAKAQRISIPTVLLLSQTTQVHHQIRPPALLQIRHDGQNTWAPSENAMSSPFRKNILVSENQKS